MHGQACGMGRCPKLGYGEALQPRGFLLIYFNV